MSPREIALEFVRRFCAGDVEGLAPLLARDVRVEGPLLRAAGPDAYLARLRENPPAAAAHRVLSVAEGETGVSVFYEQPRDAGALTVAAHFEIEGGAIRALRLAFDARGFADPAAGAADGPPAGDARPAGGSGAGGAGQDRALPVGKLPADLLARLLDRYAGRHDPRVLVGAGVGEDAAVIDMGERCLVAKTDPVTFATDEIGWYAVNVNANDVACCGATPRWFLATVLLPEGAATPALAETILAQIAAACGALGVTLCGGHTEITYGLDRPLVAGQMLGEVEHGRHLGTAGARPGDALILTKGIAVEGTAILARERPETLAAVLDPPALARAAAFLHEPGISVVRDAAIAIEAGGVHALHDPTEGGLATALRELAEAAGAGVAVDAAAVPVLPECEAACRRLGLDPMGLIASGALLVAADPERAPVILERLAGAGIAAARIGEVTPRAEGCRLRGIDGVWRALPVFARDELARLF